jgi:hypothetical protein
MYGALAVLVDPRDAAGLEDGAGVHLGEAGGIDAQDLGVAVVRDPLRQAEVAGEVEVPAGDALRVLADERALARGDLGPCRRRARPRRGR